MILWLILFLLVIALSFILAFRSMKDYQEVPQKSKLDYSVFLIRQVSSFDAKLLDSICQLVLAKDAIISIERVFKGRQTALTIFAPKVILDQFQSELNLLELEDYTANLASDDISVWEVGERETGKFTAKDNNNIFSNLPPLSNEDQFFWQIILGKNKTQIRAAVYSKDPVRRKTLISELQNLNAGGLVKIPKPFSNEQMLEFYRKRALAKDSKGPDLNSEEVLGLLKV